MDGTDTGQFTVTSLQAPCSPTAQTLHPICSINIGRNVFCYRGNVKQVAELASASTKESFAKQGKVEGVWDRNRKEMGKMFLEEDGTWNRTA